MSSGLEWTLEYVGHKYAVSPKGLRIGRAPDNDIVIPHERVSRLHSTVYGVQGVIFIRDEVSKNGTYLNSKRITAPMPLRPGDQIRIGDAVLNVRYAAIAVARQQPLPPPPSPGTPLPNNDQMDTTAGLGHLFKNAIPLVSRVGFITGGIVTLWGVIQKASGEIITGVEGFLVIATMITSGMVVFWRIPKIVDDQTKSVPLYPRRHRVIAGVILAISSVLSVALAIRIGSHFMLP